MKRSSNNMSCLLTLMAAGGILSLLAVASCGAGYDPNLDSPQAGLPLSDSETLEYRSCSKDEDCVYAQNGCCDCANGGEDLAVNTNKLADFLANFECEDVACTMIAAVPACGTGTITCESGLCEYTPSTELPLH